MVNMSEYQQSEEPIMVVGPTGSKMEVMHEKEKEFFENAVNQYLSEFKFTNVSDLQDLEGIIGQELLRHRYQQWITKEQDYWGNPIDVDEMNKILQNISKEVRLLKSALGINKTSRDKDKGESVAAYIENLRKRAKEFGIVRNEQAVKAITLWKELEHLIVLRRNCTPDERKQQQVEDEDVLNWIENIAIPEFNEIDEQFRKTSQKYWIQEI